MTESVTPCPRCGAPASGNFCAACGAALKDPTCATCGTSLSPGAKFCHKCGAATTGGEAPVAAAARPAPGTGVRAPLPAGDRAPWAVAGVLTVITLVAVIYAATRHAAPAAPSMANAGNAVPGSAPDGDGGALAGKVAPPIDQMTPREQFNRLVARISKALAAGDSATVIDFTPMALGAYANLPPGDRDIDARFHAAVIQARVGMLPAARSLADTILNESPDNLLGLYVRALVAGFQGDSTAAKSARATFRAHYDAEMKKSRPEYDSNRVELQAYRKGEGSK